MPCGSEDRCHSGLVTIHNETHPINAEDFAAVGGFVPPTVFRQSQQQANRYPTLLTTHPDTFVCGCVVAMQRHDTCAARAQRAQCALHSNAQGLLAVTDFSPNAICWPSEQRIASPFALPATKAVAHRLLCYLVETVSYWKPPGICFLLAFGACYLGPVQSVGFTAVQSWQALSGRSLASLQAIGSGASSTPIALGIKAGIDGQRFGLVCLSGWKCPGCRSTAALHLIVPATAACHSHFGRFAAIALLGCKLAPRYRLGCWLQVTDIII